MKIFLFTQWNDNNTETLILAFLECPFVINFWKDVENWIKNVEDPHAKIGEIEKIFGKKSTECIINRAITSSIQIIYRKRHREKIYFLAEVKRSMAYQMQLEEYRASLSKIWCILTASGEMFTTN